MHTHENNNFDISCKYVGMYYTVSGTLKVVTHTAYTLTPQSVQSLYGTRNGKGVPILMCV